MQNNIHPSKFVLCKKPNLPQHDVVLACVAMNNPTITNALNELGIHSIKIARNPNFISHEAYHPDMNLCHLGQSVNKKNVIVAGNFSLGEILKKFGFWCCIDQIDSLTEYPKSIYLNSLVLEDHIICNKSNTSQNIINFADMQDKIIINTKQGYCKCACAVVNGNSIITEDFAIAKSCSKFVDCLLIRKGFVGIDGFDYGFIGGSAFKINSSTLCFCGLIKNHPDYNKIKSFCSARGVSVISLFPGELHDCGSVLPMAEKA